MRLPTKPIVFIAVFVVVLLSCDEDAAQTGPVMVAAVDAASVSHG